MDERKLWNGSLRLFAVASFLIYASTYLLLPVLLTGMRRGGVCTEAETGGSVALFALGMFLPGAFNSYLIDRFRRPKVCTLPLLGTMAVSYLYPFVTSAMLVGALRLVQGMLFGITTMALGSTLVIDVTASHRRTEVNVAFAWINRMAMAAGLAAGVFGLTLLDVRTMTNLAVAMGLLAWVFILMVSIPFRAPLETPLCSLDRFLLPRAFLPATGAALVAMVLGKSVAEGHDAMFFAVLLLGLIASAVLLRAGLRKLHPYVVIALGALLLVLSLTTAEDCAVAALTGVGIGLSASCLFRRVIGKSMHCERGTANNTFQLFWELGMMAGILL